MKKYLRVILKGTPVIFYDIEMPEDAAMYNIVANLQMSGYVLGPKVFVPYDSIAHMCILETQGEQTVDFTKARMQ